MLPARLWSFSQIKVASCTIVNLVDDNVINDITTSIENQCKEEKLAFLSKSDITDVLHQFVSLHMPRIIDLLNVKLSDNK